MRRALIFAKRNLKEIIREPLSLIFNFIFPIALLLLFFCFVFGKDEITILKQMSMFAPNKIVPAIVYFSFTFLTLFSGMLVSKDRTSSFTARLKSSPLKPYEFFIGYSIPMVIIALIQIVAVYIFGYLLSFAVPAEALRFNLFNGHTLLSAIIALPMSLFYISLGILLGTIISDKAVGGVASIIVNVATITGGIFMPLAIMGGFKVVCQALPFYHSVSLLQDVSMGAWPNSVEYYNEIKLMYQLMDIDALYNIFDTWYIHFIYSYLIIAIMIALSILMFKKKMKSDN